MFIVHEALKHFSQLIAQINCLCFFMANHLSVTTSRCNSFGKRHLSYHGLEFIWECSLLTQAKMNVPVAMAWYACLNPVPRIFSATVPQSQSREYFSPVFFHVCVWLCVLGDSETLIHPAGFISHPSPLHNVDLYLFMAYRTKSVGCHLIVPRAEYPSPK